MTEKRKPGRPKGTLRGRNKKSVTVTLTEQGERQLDRIVSMKGLKSRGCFVQACIDRELGND